MIPILAGVLTGVTLVLVLLWRGVMALRGRPAPRFWRHTMAWHLGLFLFHSIITVPLALGVLASRFVGTRGDESAYRGPRVEADGTWQVQSRETLAAERAAGGARRAAGEPSPFAVYFDSRDGVRLRGFLLQPPAESLGPEGQPRFAAVLVHGLYRNALEIETPGRMLREMGGEVLLLEMRNHGGSGRARPTFGLDESLDVLAAVQFLRARVEPDQRPLVLYAVSLGTAAAALIAPQIPHLDALILDAPMDELRATAVRMLGRLPLTVPLLSGYWRSSILWSADHLGRIPFDEVDPRASLSRMPPEVRVLLIGAGHDWRMPPESVRALFDALPTAPDSKKLWIEPDASHGKVWVTAPDAYRARLREIVDSVAASPQTPSGDATSE